MKIIGKVLKISVLLFFGSLLAPLQAQALELSSVSEGDVIEVELRHLLPTQPSVGYDQVFYKLGRYQRDLEKHFDEICENRGAVGVERFSTRSDIRDPASFTCKAATGSQPGAMKTVVIAPDDTLYLTDGHHTFNVYWHMNRGGPDFSAHVVVAADYRQLESMAAFWEQMQADGNVWLLDHEGLGITPEQLPTSLGLEHFGNDQYRALMYFSRGIAWHKPESMTNPETGERYPAIPFLEFYWAREVRQRVDLTQFDLNDSKGYNRAIRAVSDVILKLDLEDVGGSGRSVQSMGQYPAFNAMELDRINRPGRGKLSHMLFYKKKFGSEYDRRNVAAAA
jgi:hypothetical protein